MPQPLPLVVTKREKKGGKENSESEEDYGTRVRRYSVDAASVANDPEKLAALFLDSFPEEAKKL